MKVTKEDIEVMKYLRKKGFTLKQISQLFNCHFTLVEYYTTPGRKEYVNNYSKGWYYKHRISKLSPIEVADIVK